ncbi:MAG TPA: glycosyltransferase [Phycisphaerales bacterium]|nr:glycosyltransferase [Phycisphaerales bacterium]
MISYVIPTRNRPERLKQTLWAIEALGDHRACGGAEVVVVDNASTERLIMPAELACGGAGAVPVRAVLLDENMGAAARNIGVAESEPASEWIVMLDDDSYPDDTAFMERLAAQPADVAAVSADIWLDTRGRADTRESGGLPEVFIGCGVAIRRRVFKELGGYDAAFGYYAEEYDLAARMLLAGHRVAFEPLFSVTHAKVSSGRDMNTILGRLVRNNGWVAQRYAPESCRLAELRETRRRYRRIAAKERALSGFGRGLVELRKTLWRQKRTPMSVELWDRFTGLAAARAALQRQYAARPFRSAAIIDPGKNAWVVARALEELGVRLTGEGEDAEVSVIGTMSPGPMMDAMRKRAGGRQRVIMPWDVGEVAMERVREAA